MLARTLLAGQELGVSEEVVSVCAMLSVQDSLFYRPKERRLHSDEAKRAFVRPGGDHMMLLAVWEGWMESGFSTSWCYDNFVQAKSMRRARDVRDQLVGLMERVDVELLSNPLDGVGTHFDFRSLGNGDAFKWGRIE